MKQNTNEVNFIINIREFNTATINVVQPYYPDCIFKFDVHTVIREAVAKSYQSYAIQLNWSLKNIIYDSSKVTRIF